MTRLALGIAAIVLLGGIAGGGSVALAADAPVAGPCPADADAVIHGALPTATAVVCYLVKAQPKTVNGVVIANTTRVDFAQVALVDGRTVRVDFSDDTKPGAASSIASVTYNHIDLYSSSGKPMALLFWVFAIIAVGGALFVVSRRNLIAAVMGMVGSFLGIAAIYMLLYAQFLAVVQMLVYAGAIMVLFVFVVMILNRPEDEPVAPSGRAGQAIGGVAILYLIGRLILMLVQVQPANPAQAMAAPISTPEGYDWGSVRAVGTDLFGPGSFPFEAISILLLVAVVGAIAIARPVHAEDDDPAKKRAEGGVA
jgi:NADH-quinone oxidoreductase subunit J